MFCHILSLSISHSTRLLQAETINRLLKKQSRSKGKRNALSTAEDRPTPLASGVINAGDLDEENGEAILIPEPVIPTMYRWVSSTKTIPGGANDKEETGTRVMSLSFSVPVSVIPKVEHTDDSAMAVDQPPAPPAAPVVPPPRTIPECDIEGCRAKRKYRLVRDFQRGACGMDHLRQLEETFVVGMGKVG